MTAPTKSAAILTDERIAEIIAQWQRTSNSRYDLCRAIEAEVQSRAPVVLVDRNADEAPYRVAEFWSSANPGTKVRMLAEGADIEAWDKRGDFIRWCDAANASQIVPQLAVPQTDLLKTWPDRIWLQFGEFEPEEYPGMSEDITWCDGPINGKGDIPYIRADLAAAPAVQDAPSDELKSWPQRIWLQHQFEYTPNFEVATRACSEISWCQDNVNQFDIEYVRVDLAAPVSGEAVRPDLADRLNEIDRHLAKCRFTESHEARRLVYSMLRDVCGVPDGEKQ